MHCIFLKYMVKFQRHVCVCKIERKLKQELLRELVKIFHYPSLKESKRHLKLNKRAHHMRWTHSIQQRSGIACPNIYIGWSWFSPFHMWSNLPSTYFIISCFFSLFFKSVHSKRLSNCKKNWFSYCLKIKIQNRKRNL